MKAERAVAKVEFDFKNQRGAEAVLRSLVPEKTLPKTSKCTVDITRRKNVLCLQVDAEDTAALRAALNSFLRWTIVAKEMIER